MQKDKKPNDGEKSGMLAEFLEKTIQIGGDTLEIEYRDGQEWLTAFKGPVGFGIGSLPSEKDKALFAEMAVLKTKKRVTFEGKTYRLEFAEQESFGETVYYIHVPNVTNAR